MAALRIVADIRIDQSPLWLAKTDFPFRDEIAGGLWKVLPTRAGRALLPVARLAHILRRRAACDVVVTADLRTAQLFGLVRRLFRIRSPKHIILELMLDEERKGIVWRIKNSLQRLCFSRVEIIFVSSTREVEAYADRLGLAGERVRFLPFHTNVIEPRMVESPGGYILSAGRSGRDYATLVAAVRDLGKQVIIVSDKESLQEIDLPGSIQALCDIPYEHYLDLLHGCEMVVVPLKKLVKSTGQVAFLEAMALGKPVVATAATGTGDYLHNEVNALLVPPGDSNALRKAIERLIAEPGLGPRLARQALEDVRRKHTFDIYTGTIIAAAGEIAGNREQEITCAEFSA